jgi:hypothetical protein
MSRQKNLHSLLLSLPFTLLLFLGFSFPVAAQFCGDGICSYGEQSQCPQDYGFGGGYCGDFICSPELGENGASCVRDCVCGDGICSYPEDSNRCSADCGPPITCTADTCATCAPPSYGDADYDSIPDSLEYDLAHRFFPNIYLQTQSKDVDKSYLGSNYAIPYTVSQVRVAGPCNETLKCLEIRIGTAYLEDIGAEGHTGDS